MKLTHPRPHQSSFRRLFCGGLPGVWLAALCACTLSAHAASGTWSGASDAFWTNTPNWSASPAPDTGDTATFNGPGNGNTMIDLTGGVTISNIIFDTASAAAYTIGVGVGVQTLTLGQVNGGINMSATVTSNQILNANLALPVTGFYNLVNNSATNILTLAGTNVTTSAGSKVLTVDGTGTVSIIGPIMAGIGNMGLQKTNSGTLLLFGGGAFAATNVNDYLPGASYVPVDLRQGTTIISSGVYTNTGEFVVGGVSATTNGGPGNNVNLTINGGSLGVSTWLSLGRGNGIGGVSSDIILNNDARVYSANYSGGYNGSSTSAFNTNAPKGTFTLNNTSSLTLNGAFNHAESPNSFFTMTVNDSASVTNLSTSTKFIGDYGTGTLNINGNGSVSFGNAVTYVGYRYSTGYLNLASSAVFQNSGELRVGGSDNSGTGRNAYGVFTMNGGVAALGALTLARGNNNQNGCAGTVILNGGTLTSTNDVIVAYAGTNLGTMVINGGTLNVGTAVTKWLQFGEWDFTSAEMDITNGNLNLNTGSSIKFNTQNSSGTHTINQAGGAVTFYSDYATTVGGTGNLDLQYNSSASTSPVNTYNLNGGTLTVPQVTSSAATCTRIFNFNGGTLRAAASGASFFNLGSGSATANVRNGGAIIDCNGNDITIVSPLVHSTIAGDAATDGGLTKLGDGTLTLSTGNSFTGPMKILGGTMNVNPFILGVPTDWLVTNSTLAVDVSAGSSFSAGNVTLQNNTTVSINFGNLSANPTFPAVNASGSLAAPGTGLTIAVSGLGLRPGTVTLIKYTGTALANLANFSLTLPAGVSATLVNNQGNDSIDLNITTSPQNLTWEGTAGNSWDINTTANWKDGNNIAALYLQYTNGTFIVGDATTFDDTLTNDFVNPQPTNINFTTAVYSFPVVVNSTLPYSFGGVGSLAGSGYLVKSNTGSLFVGLSNSYSGGTLIADGTLIITNDSALGAPSGLLTLSGGTLETDSSLTNTRPLAVAGAANLDVPTNVTMQISGVATGSGTLTKLDAGTLVLAGTMSNTPAVAAGAMRVASTGKVATPGVINVGNTAGSSGVLTISGGTVHGNNAAGQFTSGIIAGSAATSAGSIQMASGTLTTLQQFGLGAGLGGYGALTVVGGTVALGSYLVVGFNNDIAVLNQTGGTVSVLTNCLTIAAGGTAAVGVGNFSAGTFTSVNATNGNSGGRGGAYVGENGTGFLNVMGSATLNLVGDANLTMGRTGTAAAGTVNLLGGTVTTAQVSKGAGSATFDFNGGTLKASTNNANFMTGLSSATIYGSGANINDNGFSVTIGQALEAPSGYGVSSIPVSSGGVGYIDAPVVTISGGSGSNAMAIAQINYTNGVVTNILVTCPGSGYVNADGISVNFAGGGGTGAAAGTPTWTPNTGGGLTKFGTGTLTLSGANTYSGATTVGGGQLVITPSHQVSGAVTVTNGATLGVLVNSAGSALAGNLNLGTSATGTNYLAFILNSGTNPAVAPLQVGTLTSTGTNFVRLSGVLTLGTFPAVKYSGALAGSGVFSTNVLGPQGLVATLSNDVASSTLYIVVTATSSLVWTGTNSAAAQTNLWSAGVTNWVLGSTPVAYTEVAPPGDAVAFNDVGSGTVLASNAVSPASISISNNAVNYTFQGPGRIAGTTGLTKQGSGTATISLAGDTYTGNTVINGGTLQLGSATAIPSGAGAGNVVVDSSGTLDLNGLSSTINGLSGSGIINNSSATASVLTAGGGNAGINWAGTITNTGAAGSSLIKTGTNSLVVTGTNYLASAAASQINGGSLLLTNGGALYMTGGAEFWVMQNAGTASAVVDGGTLVVSNNWLVIARNNVNAIGTLTVNSGLVQKAGANNIVVGSLGANGTLTVNGGQVLNNGNLWLGENTGANATLNLNGGLIQASQVRINGTTPASSVANFNGGTLQATAGSTNFFIGTTVNIQSGGLIFDDNGFAITNATQGWNDGGGGVIKKGAGTLWLDTANSYSGITLVTNGTLAGIGSVSGPLVVAPAGNLGSGDAGGVGTFTVNSDVTLQGNATLRVNKTGGTTAQDNITASGNITYGGTLTISNITADATPLTTSDTFQLFSVTGSRTGNFTNIVGSPGAGLAYSFNPASGVLGIVTGIATNPTNITATVSGNTLTLSWPADHTGWILQAQTNSLSAGLSATGWFDVAGSTSSNTNVITINPAAPTVFYRLKQP